MKSTFPSLIIALAVLLLAFAPPAACAAPPEPVATVVAIRGAVIAKNAKGVERPLAMKSPIFQDDILKTSGTGRLQLMFTDNSIISLGGASEMKIAEYRWHPEQKDGALKTQIKEGTFRVMGGALTKDAPQNFKTETPTATIGIRGSMYAGSVTPTTLSVIFQGGKGIEITNPFGTVAITKPGFGTHVALNTAPAPPKKFTEKELNDLNKQLNGNGAEEKKEKKDGSGTKEEKGSTKGEKNAGETKEGTTTNGQPATQQQTQTTTETAPAPPGPDTTDTPAPTPLPGPAPEPSPVPPPPLPEPEPLPLPPPPLPLPPPPVPVPPVPPTPPLPIDYKEITFPTPPSPPSDGIYIFKGGLGGTATDLSTGLTDTITGEVFAGVNWHNHTIFGAVFDPVIDQNKQGESPVFFFGSISGSTVSNIKVFGSDTGGPDNEVDFTEGSGSGLFLGSNFDFFNFMATGYGYNVELLAQPAVDSWSVEGAAQQALGEMQPTAPTGTETWKGFVVGVSEDMNAANTNRRLFRNTNPNGFTLNIDKDAGTFSGNISTNADDNGSGNLINNLTVGGAYGSAYIADKFLGALIGCPTNDCFDDGGTTSGLKPHGNYMVVEDPEKQFSSYFTWGYWEAAYVDPTDATQRHIHVPYSLWLAGKPTDVQPPSTFSGTYSGGVHGTKLEGAGATQTATKITGSFSLPVNFTNNSLGAGTISLSDGYAMTTTATAGGAFSFPGGGVGNSFTATISGTGTAGSLNGSFYGPNAEAMGGSFYTSGASLKYIGIFGGHRP